MAQWPAATAHTHPLTMDIQLLYQPLGVVNAVTRWISEEEMQIDTGRVMLEHLSEVEINFPHHDTTHTVYHRIHAHVSHHHQGDVVLRFHHCSRAAHQALHELMHTHQ